MVVEADVASATAEQEETAEAKEAQSDADTSRTSPGQCRQVVNLFPPEADAQQPSRWRGRIRCERRRGDCVPTAVTSPGRCQR